MTLIAYTYDIQPGSPEDITQVMANFQTIRAVVNGQLDDSNLAVAAGISAAKIAGYPNDGSKSLRGDGTWLASGGIADGHGTSLPGSPSGGDRFVLVDAVANPTWEWYFRYNSGSSSAYKWECIGGAPKYVEVINAETTTSQGYTNLSTVGPTFTVPRAGDYLIAYGFSGSTIGPTGLSNVFRQMAIAVGAAAAADPIQMGTLGDAASSVSRSIRKDGVAAASAIQAKYRTSLNGSGIQSEFSYRWLTVMPIRVS